MIRSWLLGFLAWLPLAAWAADGAGGSRPRNVLLFVAEGLRPGALTPDAAPAMTALMARGVRFLGARGSFPGLAIPAAVEMATGRLALATGLIGDAVDAGARSKDGGRTPFLERGAALRAFAARFQAVGAGSLLAAAAKRAYGAVSVGKRGPATLFGLPADSGVVVLDGETPAATEIADRLRKAGLPSSGTGDWFRDAAAKAALPMLAGRGKPFALVFWSAEPDAAQHAQEDSLGRLLPGIDGPTSTKAVSRADRDLSALLDALRDLGLAGTTDVILASGHGASTLTRESATSLAAGERYADTPARQLPPGFLALDLARALKMPLLDPDSGGQQVSAGQHSARGNGLLGEDRDHPRIVVVADEGADLLYLPGGDRDLARRVVEALSAEDYVGGVFTSDSLGPIPGALPLSALGAPRVRPAGSPPPPAIVVTFRSFATGCDDPAACGVEVADLGGRQGQGAQGALSQADLRVVLGAEGPDFKHGLIDPAPAGNADIGQTMAFILRLPLARGDAAGRVLTEAMPGGKAVAPRRREIASAPDALGHRTALRLSAVGATRYLEAGGYPGRGLGLPAP